MKVIKIYTGLLIIVVALFSCISVKNAASSSALAESNSELIVQSSEIKSSLIDTVVFKESRIIQLETNDNSLLGEIKRIYYDENKLFILDKTLNKIVVFDMTGKYITDIQRIGQAQGEYISVMDFCIDTKKKQILLLCDRPYKIISFDYSGQFLKEKKLDDCYIYISTNSNFVFCNKSEIASYTNKDYEIDCYSSDFESKHSYLPLRDNIKTFKYASGNQMTSTLNRYYSRRFDNCIYQLNPKNVIDKYTIDFADNSIPESELNTTILDDLVKLSIDNDWVYCITDFVESNNYFMFNTNIALYVYDKKSKELNGYEVIQNSILRLGSNSYYPINNSKMIASVIKPTLLSDFKKIASKRKSDNFELLKLADKVMIEDNPILILYEFKN